MRSSAIIAALSMAATAFMPGVTEAQTTTDKATVKPKPKHHTHKHNTCGNHKLLHNYSVNYQAVVKLHGKLAPGRNIRNHGLSDKRKAKCRHIRKSLQILRRMRMPVRAVVYVNTGPPRQPPAGTRTVHAGGTLSRIAQCESGGNYSINTGNGFYGAYQFDQQTWNSVGGSGNPAAASPAEQDKRAAILMSQRGSAPWPVCGR